MEVKKIFVLLTHCTNKNKEINHGLLQSNKYNDFVLSWRNNATTSRHQRRQCVGRRRIRDDVPSLESRAFYRWATPRPRFQRDVAPATEHIFAPSELLMIYFVYGDFQLSNPVGYGYLRAAKY